MFGSNNIAMRASILGMLLVASTFVLLPAGATSHDTIGFGFPHGEIDEVEADGNLELKYCSIWASGSVPGDLESKLQHCIDTGTIPVVHWYYWGDKIRPWCVDYQTASESTSDCGFKNQQDWFSRGNDLADRIKAKMGTAEAWVTVELEWNKANSQEGWSMEDDNSFPGELKQMSDVFQQRGLKTVAPAGSWDFTMTHWQVFLDDVNAVGSQILKSCVRSSSDESLRESNQDLRDHLWYLKNVTGGAKPLMVFDWGIATYSGSECQEDGPDYELVQRDIINDFFTNWIDDYRDLGVFSYIYRLRLDPGGSSGYHGPAEDYFGFVRSSGTWKPAYQPVLNGIAAEETNGGGGSPPPGPQEQVWGAEAESFSTKSTGSQITSTGASGGAYWALWTNGHISNSVTLPRDGQYEIRVDARGDYASGWPLMRVSVDGVAIETVEVNTEDVWVTFVVTADLTAGTHTLKLEFTNDYLTSTEDRNLKLDKASVWTTAVTDWSQQAEDFTTKSTGSKVSSSGASGGAYWALWANGHIETSFSAGTTGVHQISVSARGDPAAGVWPHMKVYVDGVLAFETDATTENTWQTYTGTTALAAGTHTLKIEFTNDYLSSTEDRNLKLDWASVKAV